MTNFIWKYMYLHLKVMVELILVSVMKEVGVTMLKGSDEQLLPRGWSLQETPELQ